MHDEFWPNVYMHLIQMQINMRLFPSPDMFPKVTADLCIPSDKNAYCSFIYSEYMSTFKSLRKNQSDFV